MPPRNVMVWIKRYPNKIEDEPIYLGMRNGSVFSSNADPSVNCHWYGIHKDKLQEEHEFLDRIRLNNSFSEITVKEWAFVEYPQQTIK